MESAGVVRVVSDSVDVSMATSHLELPILMGDFSSEEARDQVLSLLLASINYQRHRTVTSLERTGDADTAALSRIKQLKQSREEVLDILQEAEQQGRSIKVESLLKISMID
ncbi:MAG: hypothetical protein MI867_24705 [Pseudomonadales bacterium]|nr:hypothetical protein [Pseudomonadales bacterium]